MFYQKSIRKESKVKHLSVNACLAPVVSMHGQAVTTVEVSGLKFVILYSLHMSLYVIIFFSQLSVDKVKKA